MVEHTLCFRLIHSYGYLNQAGDHDRTISTHLDREVNIQYPSKDPIELHLLATVSFVNPMPDTASPHVTSHFHPSTRHEFTSPGAHRRSHRQPPTL